MFRAQVTTRGPQYHIALVFVLPLVFGNSHQACPDEESLQGIAVKWSSSIDAVNIVSVPVCYNKRSEIVTRNCTNGTWSPPLKSTSICAALVENHNLRSCPPGYHIINENSTDFCYRISEPSVWDYPCFKSGGASIITDLSPEEVESLLESLKQLNVSQYYWLPARRQKVFNPAVWSIPGPNWLKIVEQTDTIPLKASIIKNCLLLDIVNKILTTEKCQEIYPSLCFYINDINYPAKCPQKYQSFRFLPDDGVCYGLEYADNANGSTLDDFLESKCSKLMGDGKSTDVTAFVFKQMATTMFDLKDHEWCWFGSSRYIEPIPLQMKTNNKTVILNNIPKLYMVINKYGSLGRIPNTIRLSCIACEKDIAFRNSEFNLEYNELNKIMYLTVYYPTGLWKYDAYDKGVRCYSNARGFIQIVEITEFVDADGSVDIAENDNKVVYEVETITDRIAQYWCEGHSKKFSLISTKKIIANPQGDMQHVFALCVRYLHSDTSELYHHDWESNANLLAEIFNAMKVVTMDVLNYTKESAIILYHIHVTTNNTGRSESQVVQEMLNSLEETAKINLPKYNIEFINISSSIYCLPSETQDKFMLEWELSPIGYIAAPTQFCLQSNGLPVKRRCGGSYLLGAKWEPVEGYCNSNYQPSNTTNFLYSFAKGTGNSHWTKSFMTIGLRYVLNDVDIIIPADIYYLSVCLKQIISIANTNRSSVDIGDLQNIAWIVDRLMVLNNQYLNLAQTFNSTNVILDSITDLIEILELPNTTDSRATDMNDYQIAVKPQFITQIAYPDINNITGLALLKISESDLFTDLQIKPLYKNTSLEALIEMRNLEVATWLPDTILKNLFKNNNMTNENYNIESKMHILINVFYNDAIFQEVDQIHYLNHSINSRIVEIKIPGYSFPSDFSIHLIFKVIHGMGTNEFCGYWNFRTDEDNGLLGQWKRRGCYLESIVNNLVICKCFHLTHFAQLISWNHNGNHDEANIEHSRVLNIITLFGSFLSLLGIVGIWITALVFSMWRQKAGTKILLQLTTATALPLILMIFFSLDDTVFAEIDNEFVVVDHMRGFCIGLGALLHYSILAGFVWMLITAVLQFIRYVRVLGPQRSSLFMIKMSIFGWGLPSIPVVAVLLIDKNSYIPTNVSTAVYNAPLCYPTGIYFIFSILVPVGIIIFINVTLFICVMVSIAKGPDGKVRTPDLDLVKAQLRLSIFLFFLLGLTWIFGLFSFFKNYFWSYMFCLTSTIQGFVLFIYFVICDPATRNLWITLMKPQLLSARSRVSITSISNIS